MSERNVLLLDFVRATARHSGLRGDPLSDVFAAALACLTQGTATPRVDWVPAPLTGEDLLVAHEVELRASVEAGGLAVVEGTGNAVELAVRGTVGPLGAIRLATPPGGWDDAGAALAFAGAVVEELAVTVLRHWAERQHLDRSGALLEAQRHTHVGCFEWDIVADKVRWSDELFRIFGDEPQSFEPTFEEFLERIHADDREAVRASVYEAYEERRDYRIEERIVRADGTVRQLASWGHVIVDEQTVPVKIIGSCQDVTDFRATMHELATTERRLAEVQERRVRALELNDSVVQGLVSAIHALALGYDDAASVALNGTLRAARSIIGDLLLMSGDDIDALSLVRSEPAHSFLTPWPEASPPPPPAPVEAPIRIIIADDSIDVRMLTAMLLNAEPDFEVVSEAENGVEAIEQAGAHQPDLVLLDLAMPVLDGLAAIPQILAAAPGTRIVVFSGFNAGAASHEALARGAHAYVEKGLTDIPLPERLREIHLRTPTDAPLVAGLD